MVPFVDIVFHITDPVHVAQDLHVFGLLGDFELGQLHISVVAGEVNQVARYLGELGLVPGQRFHIDQAIQVVNAKGYFKAVSGGKLDFVLRIARH